MFDLDLTGKRALAWLCVNKSFNDEERLNTHCFVFPRYFIENKGFAQVDPTDFPDRGAVLVDVKGGKSAFEIENKFGNIVTVRFNKQLQQHINPDAENKFYARYNPSISEPDIKIDLVDSIPSHGLRQIIDFGSSYEILKQYKTLELDLNVVTTEVLIKIGNVLYGPFKTDIKGTQLTISAINQYLHYIGQYDINKFDGNILYINDEKNVLGASFLEGFQKNDIFKLANEKHDWIPDDIFIKEIITVIKSNEKDKMTREEKRKITALIEENLKTQKNNFWNSTERVNKALQIMAEVDKSEELREQLVYEVLNTEEYLEPVVAFIEKQRFDLIKDKLENISKVRKEREHLIAEKNEIELELKNKGLEKAEIVKDIEKIKREIENKESETLERVRNEIQVEQRKKDDLVSFNQIAENVVELQQQKKKLREDRDKAQQEYNNWVGYKKDIEKGLNDKISNFTSAAAIEIIDKEFLMHILEMLDRKVSSREEQLRKFDENLLVTEFTADDLIKNISSYAVEKAGRIYSRNDIVNFLVCITQGFITTFAGEPGTGKTSLCNIIARALGLAREDDSRRFVEVSVERGWSSFKDYIGYYNPLTKCYEKSNEAVFSAFQTLDNEEDISKAPYFILLDEANLSPIEHYWANFIRLCDMDNNGRREINIGGETTWKIPDSLRFLATVNFDHTTEELSPRFLDRTWVIMLEQSNLVEDLQMDESIENYDQVFDFNKIIHFFTPKDFSDEEYGQLDEAIKTKWDNIQNVFISKNMPITSRSRKMVYNYCLIASKYMDTNSAETRFAPLDYAVAQKILPTLNGFGKKYKELVEALLDECKNAMPLCKKHLERMKESEEENMGYYTFFTR